MTSNTLKSLATNIANSLTRQYYWNKGQRGVKVLFQTDYFKRVSSGNRLIRWKYACSKFIG